MTTRYVDPAAGGANNGSSWTDAWTSLQSAADTAVAGDVVYCRGNETTTAAIDFDTNSGTHEAGMIRFIGCNSGGTVDGTRFTITASGGSAHHGITFAAALRLVWFENIAVINAGTASRGWNLVGTRGHVFINCLASGCGGAGFGNGGYYLTFIRCVSHTNTGKGFDIEGGQFYLKFCCVRDNSADGFSAFGPGSLAYGCIGHNNTDDGIDAYYGSNILNSVFDDNTNIGIRTSLTDAYPLSVIGNRITNHAGVGNIGLYCNDDVVVSGWNYFEGNTDNISGDARHLIIPLEGGSSSSNLEDLSNTNQGYVDPTNHDFSTGYTNAGDPDLRRTAITIPWS